MASSCHPIAVRLRRFAAEFSELAKLVGTHLNEDQEESALRHLSLLRTLLLSAADAKSAINVEEVEAIRCQVAADVMRLWGVSQREALIALSSATSSSNTKFVTHQESTRCYASQVLLMQRTVIVAETFTTVKPAVSSTAVAETSLPALSKTSAGGAQSPVSSSNAILKDVHDSIDALKSSALNLRERMSSESHLIDASTRRMEAAVDKTTTQSNDVALISGSKNELLSLTFPGGKFLQRIPGLLMFFNYILLPLWSVIRHALMILGVVVVTAATVWMMLMVPRAYVRAVNVITSDATSF